jgi:2,4-dienoyl-CoA reductase-like NADH-dependent reductase (Old Yellow Enzyme family)
MCQYSAQEGNATDWHRQHVCQMGFSGAALVMLEMTAVRKEGRITHGCLGLFSDENEKALERVIATARKYSGDTKFGIQIAHAGRKASSQKPWEGGKALEINENPWQTVAPSAIPYNSSWPVPRALEISELNALVEDFVRSAQRAARLGFDVVEVHSAHGYLLHQFLSPLSNQRSDRYGGSLENRMRFPLRVAEAVRQSLPSHIAVGSRINSSDWVEGGFTLEDAVVYAKQLKKLGLDYVCASSGGITSHIKIPTHLGYQVPFATKIKQETGMTTRAVGLIVTPKQAEEIVSSGKADCVAIARAVLDDPRWGWHAADELGASIHCPNQYDLARPPRWRSSILHST